MPGSKKAPQATGGAQLPVGRDDALNDQIQQVLRDSAEAIAERTRSQAAADAESARLQLDAVLALARGRDRSARS